MNVRSNTKLSHLWKKRCRKTKSFQRSTQKHTKFASRKQVQGLKTSQDSFYWFYWWYFIDLKNIYLFILIYLNYIFNLMSITHLWILVNIIRHALTTAIKLAITLYYFRFNIPTWSLKLLLIIRNRIKLLLLLMRFLKIVWILYFLHSCKHYIFKNWFIEYFTLNYLPNYSFYIFFLY